MRMWRRLAIVIFEILFFTPYQRKINFCILRQIVNMAILSHILMRRNGDYFLNYIDYSKNFDAVLKLLLVI